MSLTQKSWVLRLTPVAVIVLAVILSFSFDLRSVFSPEGLIANKDRVFAWINARPMVTGVVFAGLYAVMVALSLPVASGLTLLAGLLFGAWWGFFWSFLGAMGGATAVYLVARFALGDLLHARSGTWVAKLEKGFHENEFSYLLMLRLLIVVPFFAINAVSGLLNVRLSNYVLATGFGIIPATLLKTFLVGGEIRDSFLLHNTLPPLESLLLDPRLWIAMLALAALSLGTIFAKRMAGDHVKELRS